MFTNGMESLLQEPCTCLGCPGLIAGTVPHAYCLECLGHDHAEAWVECRALPLVRRQQRWEHFCFFDVSLHYDKSEPELEIYCVETSAHKCPKPLPFNLPKMKTTSPLCQRPQRHMEVLCRLQFAMTSRRCAGVDHSDGSCWASAAPCASPQAGEPPLGGVLQPIKPTALGFFSHLPSLTFSNVLRHHGNIL